MHSSRMRTIRSSDRISGGCLLPWGGGVCSLGGCLCLLPQECLLLGGPAPGGVCSGGCLLLGGCLLPGDVCSQGCLLLGGVCSQGGCLLQRECLLSGVCSQGVSAPGGVCTRGCLLPVGVCGIPACTEADTPPLCGQTDACKNMTFATSLRTVIMSSPISFRKLYTFFMEFGAR